MKKYFKYFLVFLCIFVMVFCFSGCSKQEEEKVDNNVQVVEVEKEEQTNSINDEFLINSKWFLSYEENDGEIFNDFEEDAIYFEFLDNTFKVFMLEGSFYEEKFVGKYKKDDEVIFAYDLNDKKIGEIKVIDDNEIVFVSIEGIKEFLVKKENNNFLTEEILKENTTSKYSDVIIGNWCHISKYNNELVEEVNYDCREHFFEISDKKYFWHSLVVEGNEGEYKIGSGENEFLLEGNILLTYDELNDKIMIEYNDGSIDSFERRNDSYYNKYVDNFIVGEWAPKDLIRNATIKSFSVLPDVDKEISLKFTKDNFFYQFGSEKYTGKYQKIVFDNGNYSYYLLSDNGIEFLVYQMENLEIGLSVIGIEDSIVTFIKK